MLVNPENAFRYFTKLLAYHICPPGVGTVRTGRERGVGPTGGGDDREGRRGEEGGEMGTRDEEGEVNIR